MTRLGRIFGRYLPQPEPEPVREEPFPESILIGGIWTERGQGWSDPDWRHYVDRWKAAGGRVEDDEDGAWNHPSADEDAAWCAAALARRESGQLTPQERAEDECAAESGRDFDVSAYLRLTSPQRTRRLW